MTSFAEVQQLRALANEAGFALNENQTQQLLAYRDLITKWNKVYNLTALRDPALMLSHHIIDSLAAVPPLHKHLAEQALAAPQLLDVGSGGGLPGVVMAICLPQVQVTCVDAVGKKAAFVQQVAGELKLANLRGVHARVEALAAAQPFDVITSRAFASLSDFVQLTAMHLAEGGAWMALKGKMPQDEMAALPHEVRVFRTQALQVPRLDAERCVVWMGRAAM
jgi:16S rRNA (guanine527-N7)-methyltransferase